MKGFVGRGVQLGVLAQEVDAARSTGQGRFITVRGRRQVGKTTLIERWLEEYGGPSVFFEARGYTERRELERFREAIAGSSLPGAAAAARVVLPDLEAALLAAGAEASHDRPSVLVIDEFPDLCERRRAPDGSPAHSPQEGAVRAAWRELQRRPVILVLVGSDLAMMQRLTSYGAPLFGRPTRELVVEPLGPGEVAGITGRTGADAIDAYLVTGGFPRLVGLWPSGGLRSFLQRELGDPTSEFVRTAERMLAAELPTSVHARSILNVVGSGERTHTAISEGTGIRGTNLSHPLAVLAEKRIVTSSLPLSTAPSDARRYVVADPYLRFWLRFIDPILGEVDRGLGASRAQGIADSFRSYAGRAVEPLVRRALETLGAQDDQRVHGARAVGGYWTRDNRIEVDLVGADRWEPPVRQVAFIGSIKWRAGSVLDGDDIAVLERAAVRIPGVDEATPVVAVSRAGFSRIARSTVVTVDADEVLGAFPRA